MATRYVYPPLDKAKNDIRLLHITSIISASEEGGKDNIAGHLEKASLLDSPIPKYCALSYVWGDPSPVSNIILDDGAHIPIAESALVALTHIFALECTQQIPLIWIDAVCINQSDNGEKSWQVQQMGEIYSRASTTLIFLGPGDAQTDQAMAMFRTMGQKALARGYPGMHRCNNLIYNLRNFPQHNPHYMQEDPSNPFNIFIWEILDADYGERDIPGSLCSVIMDTPWWTRIWVLQELLLSPTSSFVCGTKMVAPSELIATLFVKHLVCEFSTRMLKSTPKNDRMTALIWDYCHFPAVVSYGYYEESYRPGFVNIMLSVHDITRSIKATDPRDSVFAILALVTEWPPGVTVIKPDYSLSCIEVYVQAALAFLQHNYDAILRLAVERQALHTLPSWVPDWAANSKEQLFRTIKCNPSPIPLEYRYRHDSVGRHVLSVAGSLFGYIQVSGAEMHYHGSSQLLVRDKVTAQPTMKEDFEAISFIRKIGKYVVQNTADTEDVQTRILNMVCSILLAWSGTMESSSDYEEVRHCDPTTLVWTSARPYNSLWNDAASLMQILFTDFTHDILVQLGYPAPFPAMQRPLAITYEHEPYQELAQRPTVANASLSPKIELSKDQRQSFSRVLTAIKLSFTKYSILVCGGEYVGIGTKNMQNGDVLVDIDMDPGALFVLRPVGEGMYRLVAQAYVAQLAWEEGLRGKGELVELNIC